MNVSQKAKTTNRILVVEDDQALADLIAAELSDQGYAVTVAVNVALALDAVNREAPDLVLSDLRLPDGSGLDVLQAVREQPEPPAVLLITAFGSVPQAVEALKAGADDFLTKPIDLEHLSVRIERAAQHRQTNVLLRDLQATLRDAGHDGSFHGMVGESRQMRELFDRIRRIARVDEPVLISGESGTGKELVARAIHAQSARATAPFVAVNCASVPETLLEAEFFGHSAGAFTGAGAARPGLFREADGGILFLDEIGEMPLVLQAKLLRTLQEGCVRSLGADGDTPIDVRIIAATNRDLTAEIAAGRWRDDLYYRLETLALEVPPLRARGEDDRNLLITHFLAQLASQRNDPGLRLSKSAFDALQNYTFPGNVRELRNALIRAATFCQGSVIEMRHLPERMRAGKLRRLTAGAADPLGVLADPPPTLADIERRYIRLMLDRTGQNKQQAARLLDVSRRTIYRKLEDSAAN